METTAHHVCSTEQCTNECIMERNLCRDCYVDKWFPPETRRDAFRSASAEINPRPREEYEYLGHLRGKDRDKIMRGEA